MLFAGTCQPIPRTNWNKDTRNIWVRSIVEDENPIKAHFHRPEVQFIGATSGCGCDFPWVMFQNSAWPVAEETEKDEDQEASERFNREALVALLKAIDEEFIELYGVWANDYAIEPQIQETIPVEKILDSDFRLKERGFYEVKLRNAIAEKPLDCG
jgi:hypothetical protein